MSAMMAPLSRISFPNETVPAIVKLYIAMLPFIVEPIRVTLSPGSTSSFDAKRSLISISPLCSGIFPLTSDFLRLSLSTSSDSFPSRSIPIPRAGPWDRVSPFSSGASISPPNCILGVQSISGNSFSRSLISSDTPSSAMSLGVWLMLSA